jgi:S-adenosylmethionine decarboxylase proenzyme
MRGLHILADFYECQNHLLLTSGYALREFCLVACDDVDLNVLGDHFHQFRSADGLQQCGTTGALVLAESHLAIHTWPETQGATLDIYVCNFTVDNSEKAERLYRLLGTALDARDVQVERVWRGREISVTD